MISSPTFEIHPQGEGVIGTVVLASPYFPDFRFWLKKEDFQQTHQPELKGWLKRYQNLVEEYLTLHEQLFSTIPGGRFKIDPQTGELGLDWLSRTLNLYGEDYKELKVTNTLALKRAASQVTDICQIIPEFKISEVMEILNWNQGYFRTSYETQEQELVARVRLEPAPEHDPWFGTRAKLEQIPPEAEAEDLAKELNALYEALKLVTGPYTVRLSKLWGEEMVEIKSAHQVKTELNQHLQFGIAQMEISEFLKDPKVPKPYEVEAKYLESVEEAKGLLELYTPEVWE